MSDTAGATTASAAPLEYAPRTGTWAGRRWKRILALTLLAALALAGWLWRQELRSGVGRARLLYAQHRCLTFDPPPDRVAYEDDAAKVQALLSNPDYFFPRGPNGSPAAALYWPKVYRDWPDAAKYHRWSTPAVLFIHEMERPPGERVLVYVIAEYDTQFSDSVLVRVQVVEPATWRRNSSAGAGLVTRMVKPPADRVSNFPRDRACPVRLYAGRVDPNDRSHFTIDYEGGGHRGAMEGRLRDMRIGGEGIDLQFRRIIEPDPPAASLDSGPSGPDNRRP